MKLKYIFLGLFLLVISGCGNKQNEKENLEKISQLEEKIKKIEERTNSLETDKLFANIKKIAFLTPGSSGYATIIFDLGTLTINMKDVQAFANSTKVTLEFGNPLGATITGLKATVDWGTVDSKGFVDKEIGSKEITMEKDILSASWNNVTVTLDNIEPKNLGFIRVRNVTHSGIKLRK